MYNYGYGYDSTPNLISNMNSNTEAGIWIIISFVLAIVGAFIAYFLFVKPEKQYGSKFVNWLKSFLNFNEMLIEPILKIAYIFLALLITLASFAFISTSFVGFLLVLIFGNLLLRVTYEFFMITIGIWQNTRDINKKMK